MAQTTQIVPKYSFPYTETVINDYSIVGDTSEKDNVTNPIVDYISVFTSPKGVDNVLVKKDALTSCVKTYGKSNYRKYGQQYMLPLALLEGGNAEVWCMRVMPENAIYAHNFVSLGFKADATGEAHKRKFRIKFVGKSYKPTEDTKVTTKAKFKELSVAKETAADKEGYTVVPFMAVRSAGRGKYGDDFRIRTVQSMYYEKEYGIKMYTFEAITTEGGLKKTDEYTASIYTSSKYELATLINDILDDVEEGVCPIYLNVNEDSVEDVYDAYCEFVADQITAVADELEAARTEKARLEALEDGDHAAEIKAQDTLIAEIIKFQESVANFEVPAIDEFDPIYGRTVASQELLPYIKFTKQMTADVNTSATDYVAADYTSDAGFVAFDSVEGVKLSGGYDGYFTTPRTEQISTTNPETDEVTTTTKVWTLQEEIDECYKKAFSGAYDKRILSAKRIKANALFDQNYSLPVKEVLASLAVARKTPCYLDTGIMSSLSSSELNSLINDYAGFTSELVSKNIHHYLIKERGTQKRIPVTITYFLAQEYKKHVIENGVHVPFVKANCQLSGHIKESLTPSIDDFEADLKEALSTNRFNYFDNVDQNVYQRATQNTAQPSNSDLTEESNVATLYEAHAIIEKDLQERLYNFADPTERSSFRQFELAKFNSWKGSKVQSIDIKFEANALEAERSIIHAYLVITFRGIQKRGIIEIDINKRTYNTTTLSVNS